MRLPTSAAPGPPAADDAAAAEQAAAAARVAHRLRHLVLGASRRERPRRDAGGGEVVVGGRIRRPRGARAVGERAPQPVRVVGAHRRRRRRRLPGSGALIACATAAQSMWPLRLRSTHGHLLEQPPHRRARVAEQRPRRRRRARRRRAARVLEAQLHRHRLARVRPPRVAHARPTAAPTASPHRRLLLGLRRRQLAVVGVQVLGRRLDDAARADGSPAGCSLPHWRTCGRGARAARRRRRSCGHRGVAGVCGVRDEAAEPLVRARSCRRPRPRQPDPRQVLGATTASRLHARAVPAQRRFPARPGAGRLDVGERLVWPGTHPDAGVGARLEAEPRRARRSRAASAGATHRDRAHRRPPSAQRTFGARGAAGSVSAAARRRRGGA